MAMAYFHRRTVVDSFTTTSIRRSSSRPSASPQILGDVSYCYINNITASASASAYSPQPNAYSAINTPQVSYRGGTVVVRPSNDKQSTYTNEGASSSYSSQSAALAQSSRSLDALLDSTFGSPPVIPPLPFQLAQTSSQTGPPSVDIPTRSRSNNNPFINQFMVVPPVDIPLPTLEEGHVSG